ncbi:MAG: hypothetical protein JOZ27_07975, partial [Caulobacteraceae bacterium]|nr:hypothetical protein [Caulobacteraceae bacterium]
MRFRGSILTLLALAVLTWGGAGAGVARAALLYATDFSASDGFTPGPIDGQNGWQVFSASGQASSVQIVPGSGVVVPGGTLALTGPYHPTTATGLVDLFALIGLTTPAAT